MSKEDLERLDDQIIAALNAHDADAYVDAFADDFVWHDWSRPEPIRDRDAARQSIASTFVTFPDMQVKSIDRVVGEDGVAAEIEWTGTNSGPMPMGNMEMPPTNKTVTGRGSYIFHVRDGKIAEARAHPDIAGMMMQLGLMPGM
jgi:steroid delta-isomerase-like uncharacterized protein